MTSLIETVAALDALDDESTIYASEPWTENSKVIVTPEPQSGGLPENVEELGLKYFLEVFVANSICNKRRVEARQAHAPALPPPKLPLALPLTPALTCSHHLARKFSRLFP